MQISEPAQSQVTGLINKNDEENPRPSHRCGRRKANGPDAIQEEDRYAGIEDILKQDDLYSVLHVPQGCDAQTLRRGYMKRCKECHPE
jgi:hypothetical protein